MPDPLRPLRLNALELLRQPGTRRSVQATVEAEPLDLHHESLHGDVDVDVELETTIDSIIVTGRIEAPWSGVCRRCLTELSGRAVAEVDERYQPDPTDDEASPIVNFQLDLAPMTRQLMLLELSDERLCRPDCAGLCPVCGIDRNHATCECDTTVRDDRWAALEGLELDD